MALRCRVQAAAAGGMVSLLVVMQAGISACCTSTLVLTLALARFCLFCCKPLQQPRAAQSACGLVGPTHGGAAEFAELLSWLSCPCYT
jgi:hypothetical protein